MFSFLKRFEDEDRSLLGPNLLILHTWGLWKRKGVFSNFMYYLFLFGCIYYLPSQYIELWLIRKDQDKAFTNLSYSLLSSICFIKGATFLFWKKHWNKVITNVSDMENFLHSKKDKKTEALIVEYTKYSRGITYCYGILVICTVFVVTVAPVLAAFLPPESRHRILNGTDPYPEIMSSWVPLNKSRGLGYYVTFLLQATEYVWGGGVVSGFDSTAFTIMSFHAGQFKILRMYCERLFNSENIILGPEEALIRIKECHLHHLNLVTHCKIMNSLLSPVLFLYIVICSVMICAAAIRLTSEGITTVQQIWLAEYLTALIFQLFLYCWHSAVLYEKSLEVDYGVLASKWWNRDARTRRSVLLLVRQLQEPIVFRAGPFATLGLPTFINILKGSYSFFTLLKERQDGAELSTN